VSGSTGTEARPIIVAVDGSPYSLQACREAARIARCFGAPLVALHVATTDLSSFVTSAEEVRREQSAARVRGEHAIDEARTVAGDTTSFRGEILFGDPATLICRRARELDAALVVVGSRGLGAVDRLLLGSVSGAVVGRCGLSVLVCRSDDKNDERGSP
jgi:nucleotide-binding universal stress UspA family protein